MLVYAASGTRSAPGVRCAGVCCGGTLASLGLTSAIPKPLKSHTQIHCSTPGGMHLTAHSNVCGEGLVK